MVAVKKQLPNPSVRPHLLWEYDLKTFNYDASASVVIERVIVRGNMEEWREILKYYGTDKVLEVARSSKQLDGKHKNFTEIYVFSEFNAL